MKIIKRLWWEILWWWKFRVKGAVDPNTVVAPPPTAIKQTKRNTASDARIVAQWLQEVDFSAIAQRIDEPWDQDGGYVQLELMGPNLISKEDEALINEQLKALLDDANATPDWRDGAPTVQEQLFQKDFVSGAV